MGPDFSQKNFIPVLLGANLNSYSLAREFHEVYTIKSIVIGKYPVTQILHSSILSFIQCKEIKNSDVLTSCIQNIAKEHKDKKILLIACSDTLLKYILDRKKDFGDNIILPYGDTSLIHTLMERETFYKLLKEENISYPHTDIITSNQHIPTYSSFPIILKANDQQEYFKHKFHNQKKVYIIESQEELHSTVSTIYKSGYKNSLCVQEYIPGDDSHMFVVNAYADRNHVVTFISIAQVLLEEHTPTARGNYSVIINSYDEVLAQRIKNLLEKIHFTGFANFDIKKNAKTGEFVFFEINCRQGNSHYHVTGAGYNMARLVTEDRIYQKNKVFEIATAKKLFLTVPLVVALMFTPQLKNKLTILKQYLLGNYVNPLFYKKDLSIKRLCYLLLHSAGYLIKYTKYPK